MTHRDDQTLLLQKEKSSSADRQLFCDSATLTIVFTQISILILAWTFAGFMTRSIQLTDSSAAWIQNNPSDTQLIVALISTILAVISSFCLCKAAQYALVRRLAWGPLPLSTMMEWAKLAQRTVSVNASSHKWSWTLFSIAWIGLLGFLTTAQVSVPTLPNNIVIYRAIQGNQANLLHHSVSTLVVDALISTPQPPPGFNLTPTRVLSDTSLGGFYLGSSIDLARNLMEAGLSAAVANMNGSIYNTTNHIGIPNAGLVSNISTGGISLSGFQLPGPGDYRIYPGPSVDPYQGLSRSLSTTQQGFTANVSCGWPNNAGTVPAVTSNVMKSVQFSVDGDSGDTWAQCTYSWSTACSPGVTYSTYGVTVVSNTAQDPPDSNLLRVSVCFGQDFNGLSNQSFLVLLGSSDSQYSTQACEVTPLVTTVQATYDTAGVVNIARPPLEQHPLWDPTDTYNTSALLWFTAYVIWTTIIGSQGLGGNQMGENLNSLSFVPINQTVLTEDYLRGMVEYLGSILNNAATRTLSSMAPNTVTADMIQSNGMLHIQTFGWSFHLRSHGPSLAGITLVTLLTVALGIFAMLPVPLPHNAGPAWGDAWAPLNPFARFNPAATMDVLLASTAGDLSKVVTESGTAYRHGGVGIGTGVSMRDEDDVGAREGAQGTRERLGVVLETTGEGWPALRTVSLGSVTEARAGVGLDVLRFFRDRRSGSGSADVVRRDEYIELGEVSQESTAEVKGHSFMSEP